jgi:phosphatidylinositol alpha-1,6-mannosyltransferase
VPQIAGDSGGAAEAVLDGETGLVIKQPSNVAHVAQAINSLLADPDRMQKMGVSARNRALSQFDYQVLTKRLADVLQVNS